MTDLKDLKKLIKLLKAEGVTEFKDSGLELKLSGSAPMRKSSKKDVSNQVNEVKSDGPSEQELLFWSADPAIAAKYSGDGDAQDS